MQKKAIPVLAMLACACAAHATDGPLRSSTSLSRPAHVPVSAHATSGSTSSATSTSRGGRGVGVGSQGQSLTVDSHAVYQAQPRNPVSTAVAPMIVSSNDTCMGSTSIGASAVSFGFSAGTTWTDANCVMLKNSREMWNMGFKGAALARLCMDGLNREALEATGIQCPPRQQEAAGAPVTQASGVNDDIYRY
ncbi:MAG TPA: hypothetical protein VIM12_13520 [Noviherbaspirillum sp.]|jgi:hypothetical protein|uniref:hypothetical protein n=1 Tax=Noviherbaspirillum sp. TaxID=1926288 RepID=UPI002F9409B1